MKTCLEKAQILPSRFSSSELANVTALELTIKQILDRQACLLPAYFVVNEIRKMYPENKDWPHWKLAGLLSNVVDSFRPLVQILSPIGRPLMLPVVDQSAHGVHHSWKLEQGMLKLPLKGNLPYDKEFIEPQTMLVRYVLEQPYSREVLCGMLGLQKQQKQRHVVLEEQLVELLVQAMERAEKVTGSETEAEELGVSHWLWHHLSSQIIYFVLFQFASFSHLVSLLHEKLAERKLRKGRDQLMWVLLQYISGSIQKNSLVEFLPLLRLYDLLYPERDPLPVPDFTRPICVHQMAAACIWIHIVKKAQTEEEERKKKKAEKESSTTTGANAAGGANNAVTPASTAKEASTFTALLQKHFPQALKNHKEFLHHNAHNPPVNAPSSDYRVALLCNAFSTTLDCLARPMGSLMESLHGNLSQKGMSSSGAMPNPGPISPIPLAFLDALTVHAKMSLIHSIVSHVIKCAQTKMNVPLAPALVETYSRLLVYTEIESLGIKGFITQVMTSVSKSQAWGIFHTLVEMFTYRVHHMQPQYRIQLLTLLHSCAMPQTNQIQLTLCVENAALRLIGLLGAAEMQPCYSRQASEVKPLFSTDSEELNRALILTLARVISVAGCETQHSNWYKELLTLIQQQTPHTWSSNTLICFPPPLAEFFNQNQPPKESKQQLKLAIEEEYRQISTMNPEEWLSHFSVPGSPPYFLCILWRMLLDTERIDPTAYTVIERIGARGLSSHLRTFCDFLVYEFANSGRGQHVNKCIDVLNEMVWHYNIVTIERLVLCLALRPLEGNEAQVCCFIIQLLLLKTPQFRSRVQEFVKDNSSEHWRQNAWHEKHLAFQRKFPERFGPPDSILESSGQSGTHQPLPTYFGNVCLRFLPVFDITIHRFTEIPPVTKSLETILEHLGCLYKFHDRPVTYLYNTLHYYEKKLRDRPLLKRKLVSSIMGSLKDVRPNGWALSEPYLAYTARPPDDLNWSPELDYYVKLVGRLVDTMASRSPFPAMDWRFNEFPNASCHALYVTSVELLALPVPPPTVANALMDVIIQGYNLLPRSSPLESWINAIGLLLTYLPESYWNELYDRIVALLKGTQLSAYSHPCSPLHLFNFSAVIGQGLDGPYVLLLAVCHAFFTHANIGQMGGLPQFVKERLHSIIRTEEQYLWLCHLIGPTLQRFSVDKPKCVFDLTVELYELLEQVDKNAAEIKMVDPICDLLYHIKYMFTGDQVKTEVEQVIRNLRPALRLRLRFISHLNPQ